MLQKIFGIDYASTLHNGRRVKGGDINVLNRLGEYVVNSN